MNLINDKPYTIRMGTDITTFNTRQLIFGSLVPWNKEWYWSGSQKAYENVDEKTIQEVKNSFLQKNSRIAYRYCKELAKKARKSVMGYYEEFVKYQGEDLAIYPDGLSMAADLQKQYRLLYESRPKDFVSKVMKEHKLEHPWAKLSFPPEVMESENGIGIYFNPAEGQEIMLEFNDVINGLKKKGLNLNEDEMESIRGLLFADAISPKFVKKLVQKYGDESISTIFFIEKNQHKYYLDYLLRRYKGHFYRNRYPGISFV